MLLANIRETLNTIQENTNKLLEENRALRQQYKDLQTSLDFHVAKFDELVKENKTLKLEVKSLKQCRWQ